MCDLVIKTSLFTEDDVKGVACIHHECIDLGFLSQLGPGFLFYLYKSISECSDAELVIAKDGHDVIGFITGAASLRPVYLHLLKHYFVHASLCLLPHIFNFGKLKRIVEILLYSKSDNNEDEYPSTELLSLAVKKEYRGSAVAKMLFDQLVKQFKNKGLTEFKIVVGEELNRAQGFYEKMGALKVGAIEVHKGANSMLYKVEI